MSLFYKIEFRTSMHSLWLLDQRCCVLLPSVSRQPCRENRSIWTTTFCTKKQRGRVSFPLLLIYKYLHSARSLPSLDVWISSNHLILHGMPQLSFATCGHVPLCAYSLMSPCVWISSDSIVSSTVASLCLIGCTNYHFCNIFIPSQGYRIYDVSVPLNLQHSLCP